MIHGWSMKLKGTSVMKTRDETEHEYCTNKVHVRVRSVQDGVYEMGRA
jgi:hypothetical protein